LAQRAHAVAQHGARGCIDHAERQAALEVLRGGDAVAALPGEEIRPRFELVIVDRLGVAGVEVFDRELELDVHVNLDHPPPAAPRAARAFPQRMQAWALPGSLRTLSRLWQSTQAVLLAALARVLGTSAGLRLVCDAAERVGQ